MFFVFPTQYAKKVNKHTKDTKKNSKIFNIRIPGRNDCGICLKTYLHFNDYV